MRQAVNDLAVAIKTAAVLLYYVELLNNVSGIKNREVNIFVFRIRKYNIYGHSEQLYIPTLRSTLKFSTNRDSNLPNPPIRNKQVKLIKIEHLSLYDEIK